MSGIGCSAIVSRGWSGGASCSRSGVIQSADGKYYCKQHLPATVAAKEAARQEKWRVEAERSRKLYNARDAERAARQTLLNTIRTGGLLIDVDNRARDWEQTVRKLESVEAQS